MTGDDYRWDQMSVMERCEVLRAGLKRVDETIAASFTVEPGWSVSEGELARLRRVEEAARETVNRWSQFMARPPESAEDAQIEIDHDLRGSVDFLRKQNLGLSGRVSDLEELRGNLVGFDAGVLNDLARRVAEIEGRGIGWRQPAGTTLLKNETHTRLLRVECEHEECGRELARLRRVEEAARRQVEAMEDPRVFAGLDSGSYIALRAALDSEPKR